jgi:tripartite-type tricarboxylate transporter receptor subunit TctC
VGTLQPTPLLPGVPTIAESGLPGFQSQSWFGIVVPAKIPRSVIMQLNKDVIAILNTTDVKEKFLRQGADPAPGTPEEFHRLMQTEYVKYQKLVKDAGISSQ